MPTLELPARSAAGGAGERELEGPVAGAIQRQQESLKREEEAAVVLLAQLLPGERTGVRLLLACHRLALLLLLTSAF